jgi:phage gp36-like protein
MAYSTMDNLLALLPEKTLITLSSDQTGATAVDADNIDSAISQADQVIDGYVGLQRQVPLDPVPGLIKTISANLAVYHLYRRRNQVPEIWANQYKADLAVLAKIGSGQIGFGSADTPEAPPAQVLTNSSAKVMGGPGGLLEGF